MKNIKNLLIFLLIAIAAVLIVTFVHNKHRNVVLKENSVHVYFYKTDYKGNKRILPIDRKINPRQTPINTAISELLKGPASDEKKYGYFTEIPKNTKLLDIQENADVIINLSNDFGSGGGSESMTSRLKQVIYTALDAVKNKPVYLELNGKKVKYIGGEGLEVPQPLSRNLNKRQKQY